MKVLVLGSEGIIGSALSKYLESMNHEVIRWDIKISHEHDMSNFTNTRKLKSVIDVADFVYFLAYDVGGAKYISNPGVDFVNRNTMIMLNTFNLLENKKFIFASSTMYNMNNVYGTLKHMGEHYTTLLNGLSVRFWNVYGREESSEKSHVIADMIHKWKTKGYIDLMTTGEEERQFLHTDDCAKALTRLMENYDEVIKTETSVDITNFEWIKIKEVAKFICDDIRVTDIKVTTHDRKNEPRDFILKFWKPETHLSNSINSLL
jgi:nucleoside-diphosphate-sugar epimerase